MHILLGSISIWETLLYVNYISMIDQNLSICWRVLNLQYLIQKINEFYVLNTSCNSALATNLYSSQELNEDDEIDQKLKLRLTIVLILALIFVLKKMVAVHLMGKCKKYQESTWYWQMIKMSFYITWMGQADFIINPICNVLQKVVNLQYYSFMNLNQFRAGNCIVEQNRVI